MTLPHLGFKDSRKIYEEPEIGIEQICVRVAYRGQCDMLSECDSCTRTSQASLRITGSGFYQNEL